MNKSGGGGVVKYIPTHFSTSAFILNTFNIENKHLKLPYYTRKSIDVSLPIKKDGSTSNHKNNRKYPYENQKLKTAKYR